MSANGEAPLVLVAHDAEAMREAMRRLLVEGGYRARTVADGHAAIAALRGDGRPSAVVLDVALGGRFAWEVLDAAQAAGGVRSILIASVYSRTSYKRRPSSLHGADDYLEQHHIGDSLLHRVARLIGPAPGGPPAAAAATGGHPADAAIRDAGEARMVLRYATREEGLSRALRLARLIVADVALYNGDALARSDLGDPRLGRDLEEGRWLFELRVPEEIRRERDFITEAITEWQRRGAKASQPVTGGLT